MLPLGIKLIQKMQFLYNNNKKYDAEIKNVSNGWIYRFDSTQRPEFKSWTTLFAFS